VAGFIGSPKMNFLGGMIEEPEEHRTRIKLDTGLGLTASVDGRRGKPGDKENPGLHGQSARHRRTGGCLVLL
jgi:multiple sugar transport system ATP-binding protein